MNIAGRFPPGAGLPPPQMLNAARRQTGVSSAIGGEILYLQPRQWLQEVIPSNGKIATHTLVILVTAVLQFRDEINVLTLNHRRR